MKTANPLLIGLILSLAMAVGLFGSPGAGQAQLAFVTNDAVQDIILDDGSEHPNLSQDPPSDTVGDIEASVVPPDTHWACHYAPGAIPSIVVDLLTQFGWEYDVDVGLGELLCAPAVKTRAGQPPEGNLDATHLRAFQISEPAPDPPVTVRLYDQFNPGGFEVDVGPALYLALPVQKWVLDPQGMPDPPPLEAEPHYKCYDISGYQGPYETVTVETQFTPVGGVPVEVQDPFLLCVPAGKSFAVQPPEATIPDAPDEVCYMAAQPPPYWTVSLITQFAADIGFEEVVPVYDGYALCVPAVKEVVAPPQYPTFSIEDGGPSSVGGGGPFEPADILSNPGAPAVCIPCAGLGLTGCMPFAPPWDDLDALTYGADFGPYSSQDGYLGFSVDYGSVGQPGTGVNNETVGCVPEPEADEFVTPLDSTNTQFFDGDGLPSCANPAAPPLGLTEPPPVGGPSDDLDALDNKDCWEIDPDQNGIPDRFVYFSLTPASPSLGAIPAVPADVLVTTAGLPPWIYAFEWQLGLGTFGPGDDVNGLCLADTGMDDIFDPDGSLTGFQDYLFYTVTRPSPSIPAVVPNAATIMYVPAPGVAIPVDTATALGLLEDNTDDVDAMKCVKGLVDIDIEDYYITLPDGTDVRPGDTASATLTVSEWTDFMMTELKHYTGVDPELSPASVTSQVGWAVLVPPLPIPLNVRFNAHAGDICTDILGAPVPCGEGGVAGVPWDPTSLPIPPPAGQDSCKDGIDNDGDTTYDDPVSNPINPDPDCVDIYDVHFGIDLPWCEPQLVDRQVQIHCKDTGEFTVTFENIEAPLGADDIDPGNNEGYIDVTIICEESQPTDTPTPTATNTPVPTNTPTPTATSGPIPPPENPDFSIQRGGPSAQPLGPFDPADILMYGPVPDLTCPALGLMACGGGDDVDAWSIYGDWDQPPPDGIHWLAFSVTENSVGAAGTAVSGEYSCIGSTGDEPEADEFQSKTLNDNQQVFDGDGLACDGNAGYPMNLREPNGDDLDALDDDTTFTAGPPGYFSLDPLSPSLVIDPGGPYGPADIFVTYGGGPPLMLYAPAPVLGLVPDDDIDALCIEDRFDEGHFDPFMDTVVFSLAAGSPSLSWLGGSPADLWMTVMGMPMLYRSAQQLGLNPALDDLNALKCYQEQSWPDNDGNGLPDQWEAQQWCGPLFAGGDWDGDWVTDDVEFGIGTDPCVRDTDLDGCAESEELAGAIFPKPGATGAYNPLLFFDYYDVPVPAVADPAPNGVKNRAIDITDVLAVLFYSGAGDGGPPNGNGVDYDSVKGSCDFNGDGIWDEEGVCYDRTPGPPPTPPSDASVPNGAIDISDVLATLAQSGLDCNAAP